MPIVSDAGAPVPAGHVRIQVRARGSVPFAWAGRAWPSIPVDYDAHRNEVADFLADGAARGLSIVWPEDYVAPDGSMPGRVTIKPVEAVADMSPHDRALAAEREAALARSQAMAAEREIRTQVSRHDEAIGVFKRDLAERDERIVLLQRAVTEAEQRAVAAIERAASVDATVAETVARMQREREGAIDTLRAEHDADMTALAVERDRLAASNAALTAEIDKLTAPAGKAPKPAKPAPAPTDAPA